MVVLKTARGLFKILNAELTPAQIAFGFCFGIAAGLVPFGWNTLFLFSIALVFNCSFSGALLTFPFAKLFSIPLASISYALGHALLDALSFLDSLWNNLFHWPVLALMDYHRYLIFGSYVLSFLIAIPVFFLIKRTVERYRTIWLESLENKLDATRAYQALQRRSWLFRLVQWAMGGRVYFREKAPERLFFRIFRKESLWAVPVLYALVLVLLALIVPLTISTLVAQATTFVIGGEVDVRSASFNSLNGRLVVPRLTVQNPSKKEENVVVLSDLALDLDLPALLSKRLVINEASVGEISFNVRREADGSLNLNHLDTGQDFSKYFDWLIKEAQKIDWIKLIKEYLKARFESPHKDDLAPYAGARDLPGFAPAFVLEKLKVGRVHINLTDELQKNGKLPAISMVDVIMDDLSWNSALSPHPIKVTLHATLSDMPDASLSWTALFDERIAHREFVLELKKVNIVALNPIYEKSLPFGIAQGVATLTAKTTVDDKINKGSATLLVEGLRLQAPANFSLFGLDPGASKAVLDGINAYAQRCPILVEFPISGTSEAPHFEIEGPLLEIAKKGLIWAGQSTLLSGPMTQIDQKLKEFQSLDQNLLSTPPGSDPLQAIFNQLLQQTGLRSQGCGSPKSE